jgi:hypothetical protein
MCSVGSGGEPGSSVAPGTGDAVGADVAGVVQLANATTTMHASSHSTPTVRRGA